MATLERMFMTHSDDKVEITFSIGEINTKVTKISPCCLGYLLHTALGLIQLQDNSLNSVDGFTHAEMSHTCPACEQTAGVQIYWS